MVLVLSVVLDEVLVVDGGEDILHLNPSSSWSSLQPALGMNRLKDLQVDQVVQEQNRIRILVERMEWTVIENDRE